MELRSLCPTGSLMSYEFRPQLSHFEDVHEFSRVLELHKNSDYVTVTCEDDVDVANIGSVGFVSSVRERLCSRPMSPERGHFATRTAI